MAAFALLAASSAQAATVTVGSPLTVSFDDFFAGTHTEANGALGEPGANVTSPVNGTIVSWRVVVQGRIGPFALRVLRPAGGGAYTGAGTSSQVTPDSFGTKTFATNLPIMAGDLLGLDLVTSDSGVGFANAPGSTIYEWPAGVLVADGSPAQPDRAIQGEELGFNAQVAPSNTFSLGATTRNKKKGTATLTFNNLPNPGDLAGSGQGAQVASTGAVTSKAVPAGTATLLVKAKGKKKRKLNEKGKVKLTIAVTYTPTLGDSNTQSVKVKLKKKL
jgi:hypothetical protein